MDRPTTAYEIDSNDCIVFVGDSWDIFANENGGTNTLAKDVIGRKVWDFVAGDVTRMWLSSLFQLSRLRGETIERLYRCDSPSLKRFMRMRVFSKKGGLLFIAHEILATEQRPKPIHIKYCPDTMCHVKQRCSFCGRINNGEWQEPSAEHADTDYGLLVVYTVCERCLLCMPGIHGKAK